MDRDRRVGCGLVGSGAILFAATFGLCTSIGPDSRWYNWLAVIGGAGFVLTIVGVIWLVIATARGRIP